ncbi:MAG: Wzz/FepE/Etk N-terminal domain-containing protein, partial [Actinomycetota bacterium]|nr:Wzz/FepE/Etk N-terminal domain-containing protein [Actinomycetota bacterium]
MPTASRTTRTPAEEQGLARYYRTCREHVLLIALCTLIGLGAAGAYVRLAPRKYTAQAQMLVTPADPGDAALVGLPVLHGSSDPTRDTLTASSLMTTPTVAQVAVQTGQLRVTPQVALTRISATPIGQSNLIALQATAGSAVAAQRLANSFAAAVVSSRAASLHGAIATVLPGLKRQLAIETAGQRAGNVTLSDQVNELQQLSHRPDPSITYVSPAPLPTGPYTPQTKL